MVILSTFPPPSEGIRVTTPNTTAHVGTKNYGTGTLYIAESRLSWVGDTGPGFSLEYPAVSLHAISRDLTAYPKECLYLMIDGNLGEAAGSESHEANEDDDDDLDDIGEIRFVPDDADVLPALFHAMTECQSLHPDQDDLSDDDEDWIGEEHEDEDDEGGDDFSIETSVNGQRIERGDGEGGDYQPMETGQFEDADQ